MSFMSLLASSSVVAFIRFSGIHWHDHYQGLLYRTVPLAGRPLGLLVIMLQVFSCHCTTELLQTCVTSVTTV